MVTEPAGRFGAFSISAATRLANLSKNQQVDLVLSLSLLQLA